MFYRDEPNDYHEFHISALPKDPMMCPVKMLLIIALRTGVTHGASIEDVLSYAVTRVDRGIKWMHPDRPVFFAMAGKMPDLTDSLSVTTGIHALQRMARCAGLLDHVTTHDIRRGALREVAHMPNRLIGTSCSMAANIAGHSHSAMAKGVTKKYIGDTQSNVYLERSSMEFVDQKAPRSAVNGAHEQQRVLSREIDEHLASTGQDANNRQLRHKAAASIRAERTRKWQQAQENLQIQDTIPKSPPPPCQYTPQVGTGMLIYRDGDDHESEASDEDVDEQCEAIQMLEAAIGGEDNGEEATDTDYAAIITSELAADEPPQLPTDTIEQTFSLPPDEFVRFFSQINVHLRGDRRVKCLTGASREPATEFQYICSNCGYQNPRRYTVQVHILSCNGPLAAPRPFICPDEECGASFTNKDSWKAHISYKHSSKPLQCHICNDGYVFTARKDLDHHKRVMHGNNINPQRCPLNSDGCRLPDKVFTSTEALRSHLSLAHRKSKTEINDVFEQVGITKPKTANCCPVPGCKKATHDFARATVLRRHMLGVHHMDEAEVHNMVSLSRRPPTWATRSIGDDHVSDPRPSKVAR